MKLLEEIQQLTKAHQLIKKQETGTPDEFAANLNISRSKVYNVINTFKILGAQIKYSRARNSFYYETPFKLQLKKKLKQLYKQ